MTTEPADAVAVIDPGLFDTWAALGVPLTATGAEQYYATVANHFADGVGVVPVILDDEFLRWCADHDADADADAAERYATQHGGPVWHGDLAQFIDYHQLLWVTADATDGDPVPALSTATDLLVDAVLAQQGDVTVTVAVDDGVAGRYGNRFRCGVVADDRWHQPFADTAVASAAIAAGVATTGSVIVRHDLDGESTMRGWRLGGGHATQLDGDELASVFGDDREPHVTYLGP